MTLKVVEPIEITEAVLTASDIPEPDASVGEVEWQDPSILGRFGNFPNVQYTVALGSDGFLYSFGRSGAVVKIDPNTSTVTTFGSYNVGRVYAAVLAGDGNIYAVGSGGTVLKLEVSTQTLSTFGSYAGTCESATLAPDGDIYCVSTNGFVLKIDVSAQTTSQFGSYGAGYKTSSLGGDGNIYCAGSRGDVLKIDVSGQAVSTFGSVTGSYYGSASGVDGNVYCVGYSGNVLRIDVSDQSISTFGSCPGSFESAALDGNGRIKCSASSSTTSNGDILEIDTASKSVYRFGSYTDNFFSIALAPNGKMFAVGNDIGSSTGVIEILDTYSPGDRVILESEHLAYQCLSVTHQNPKDGATEDSTATWIEVGPTNKWAMFDDQNSTTTKSSGPFSVELESSDYIMAYGVTGSSGLTSVRCQVYDSGSNLIYDDTQSAFDNVGAPGDFIYASEDVFYKKKLYQTDIPPTENFKAVFTFNGSDIEIGNLTVGPAIELGPCLSDSKNESLDLSEQVFDDFGNETYTERPIITFATYETISSIESSNIINRFLNVIRRKGCLWIGEVGYNQSIVTFGRIERDPIPYTMPTEIRYTIRVRGFA